ncbi:MAG TPA: trehalose-phosphatase, partial [Gemmatimonadaceae bacterium]|nr:trehalose-phosphatase [Gemmatimonadaceae bacterium]
PRPEEAVVPPATRVAVQALAAAPDTHVALVSGRGAEDARRLVGVDGVWAIGNHGLETIEPGGKLSVDGRVAAWEGALQSVRSSVAGAVATMPGARVEDKGATLSIHYRLADAGDVPRLESAVAAAAERAGLRVTRGRKVIEVRPPLAVDKGTAVLALAQRLGATGRSASILFAGDDTTDEDAMEALRGLHADAVTIHVEGDEPRATRAEFRAGSPAELGRWLAALAAVRGGGEEE